MEPGLEGDDAGARSGVRDRTDALAVPHAVRSLPEEREIAAGRPAAALLVLDLHVVVMRVVETAVARAVGGRSVDEELGLVPAHAVRSARLLIVGAHAETEFAVEREGVGDGVAAVEDEPETARGGDRRAVDETPPPQRHDGEAEKDRRTFVGHVVERLERIHGSAVGSSQLEMEVRMERSGRSGIGDDVPPLERESTRGDLDVARVAPAIEAPVIGERIERAAETVEVGVHGGPAVARPQVERLAVPGGLHAQPHGLAVVDRPAGKTDPAEGPQIDAGVVVPVAVLGEARAELPLRLEGPEIPFGASRPGGRGRNGGQKHDSRSFHTAGKVSPAGRPCQPANARQSSRTRRAMKAIAFPRAICYFTADFFA